MNKVKKKNIWQFQQVLSKRLLRWGLGSVLVGLLMRFGGTFWKKLGNQFIAWGAVDALIALFGEISQRDRIDDIPNPGKSDVRQDESKNLKRLLWVNAFLDVFYVLGGLWWSKRDEGDGDAKGNGLGVVLQGAFLFVFDVIHALNAPDE